MLPAVSSTFPQSSRPNRRKPRKPRGRGLRSSQGCTVCRARHVKCDESRPVCGPCRKRSVNCIFESNSQKVLNGTDDEVEADSTPGAEFPSSQQGHEEGTAPDTSNRRSESQPESSSSVIQTEVDATNGATIESPPLHWESPQSEFHIAASPQSAWNPSWSDENAPLRWFGLLVGDAGHITLNSVNPISSEINEHFQQPTLHSLSSGDYQHYNYSSESVTALADRNATSPSALLPHDTISVTPQSASGHSLWQAPVKLLDHEIPIFKRFVNRLGHWMDIFDPLKHFSTVVPHICMSNEGLMKAVLGLAARHMSIRPCDSEPVIDRTTAVQYYYETLHYLQDAMKHQSYTRSLELAATAHIVSMYEMIDGSGSGWERHLKGVFWIQRSQNIGAETPGLKGAGWWTWLRQDVWAAFRERRRIYSIHKHVKTYAEMSPYDLASRAVYLLAEAVNYSSDVEVKTGEGDLRGRIDRADYLWGTIDEWFRNLTVHFSQLPWNSTTDESIFKPIWMNPPEFGAAVQMANLAKVLISVNKPAPGGLRECLGREREVSEAIDTICGIALTIKDEPATVLSTQCLFAAGLYTQPAVKRQAILELLAAHQDFTGWPVNRLENELKAEWKNTETS